MALDALALSFGLNIMKKYITENLKVENGFANLSWNSELDFTLIKPI